MSPWSACFPIHLQLCNPLIPGKLAAPHLQTRLEPVPLSRISPADTVKEAAMLRFNSLKGSPSTVLEPVKAASIDHANWPSLSERVKTDLVSTGP
ncbi:hypothetical protein ILYODFUR_026339 [Ilyodon furcidens]|uniref:Uncharacterized protein n=1 Tax=Ilyodon furcidens TaxID=33524 RepID=A0ABV0V692_9TELE